MELLHKVKFNYNSISCSVYDVEILYLHSEGSDFTPVSEVLLFMAEGEKCINVLVDNDGILEETEFFFLELNTTDPRAFMFSPKATINILDNDSKEPQYIHFNMSTISLCVFTIL